MSSEVQLTETVMASPDDSGGPGETEPVVASSDKQAEDSPLPERQPTPEVVADSAAPEDDSNVENCLSINEKPPVSEQTNSDVSEPGVRLVTAKPRGSRSYQETRRSKKTAREKAMSAPGMAKCETADEEVHDPNAGCLEQRGKGDVRDSGMPQEDHLRHVKDLACHATCDGDPPAQVNVIVDEHDMKKRYALLPVLGYH